MPTGESSAVQKWNSWGVLGRRSVATTRPWGERSFYLRDPFGNPLCFVDAATLFTGPRE